MVDSNNVTAIIQAINGTTKIEYSFDDVKVQYAFKIVGMVLALEAFLTFSVIFIIESKKQKLKKKEEENAQFVPTKMHKKVILVLITDGLANFVFGTEASIGKAYQSSNS